MLYHFLDEVEAIFGIWVIALAVAATYFCSWIDFEIYLSMSKEVGASDQRISETSLSPEASKVGLLPGGVGFRIYRK